MIWSFYNKLMAPKRPLHNSDSPAVRSNKETVPNISGE
jgi:hypothetical protein